MKRILFFISVVLLFSLHNSSNILLAQNTKDTIDLSGFINSASHWYNIWAPDNVIEPLKERPKYKPEEIEKIADNILLFQKNNGGWPKNYDMQAILTDEQKEKVVNSKKQINTTYDNWTTHSHVDYLAKVYQRTKNQKYLNACLKGIDFILSSQYPNGGWPQFFPDTSGYAKYITFNDGVMSGIMEVLYKIISKDEDYSFIKSNYYNKVKAAFDKGLKCILKCQIIDNGELTIWGQQHDNITLKPQWARTFEPPSICNGESSDVVLFLMKIKNPTKEVIKSIQSAAVWFEKSKIKGIKIGTKQVPTVKYQYSTVSHDRFVVEDPSAPPIWPRYTELGTRKPLFCNRDSKVVYSLAEVLHERRASYGWYTYDPQKVLDEYPEWQRKWMPGNKAVKK